MLENYRWLDLICPISFFVAFLASAPWGRKPWCMVDCSASFTFGVGLILLPEVILGFQITGGKLDDTHSFLLRQIGTILIGQSVSLYLSRHSADAKMFGNIFYSRVFSGLLFLLAQSYSAYHLWDRKGLHFNGKYLLFACAGVGFWTLGSLIQLLRYKEIGGYIRKPTYISAGFLMDHFVLLLCGVLLFAFPTQVLKTMMKQRSVDGVHVCLLRSAAALLIGHALTSNSASGFLYLRDQRSHVIGRLTTQVLTFSNNIFGHFVTDIFTLYHVTPFMLTGFYITFLLTVFFRFNNENEAAMAEMKLKASSMSSSLASEGSSKRNGKWKDQRDDSLDEIDRDDGIEDASASFVAGTTDSGKEKPE